MIMLIVVFIVHLVVFIVPPVEAFLYAGDGVSFGESRAAKRLASTVKSPAGPVGGTYEALVIFARFADDPPQAVPSWGDSLFRPEVPGSVAHYYEEQSFGRLHLRGTVLPQVYASRDPRSAYLAPDASVEGGADRFCREVVERTDADIDFRPFDGDGDGVVDLVVVLLVGKAVPNFIKGPATGIGQLGERSWRTDDGVMVVPSASGVAAVVRSLPHAVGSIAHELGHWLGLPDLYDLSALGVDVGMDSTGQRNADPVEDSAGIGVWGIMGWGALGWDGRGVSEPVPLGAWEREQLGWVGLPGERGIREIVTSQVGVRLTPVMTGGEMVKLWVSPMEYFLVELRDPQAGWYERGCPGRGILIWHIDEAGQQFEERRKRVDVECADGRYRDAGYPVGQEPDPLGGGDNLDFWAHDEGYRRGHNGNLGDATDLYDGVRFMEFTPVTNPNTQRNDGMPSELAIRNIQLDPSGASFDIVGWEGTPVVEVGEVRITDATGDGVLEPGEVGQVAVPLTNRGEAPAGHVEVTFEFDQPVVAPRDTTVSRILRWVGDTTTVMVPLRVNTPLAPGTTVMMTMAVTPERGEAHVHRIPVPLIVPDLQIMEVTVLDGGRSGAGWGNGDGVLNPGEIVGLDLRVCSGTGWQPWPFLGRLRFLDLPGSPVERMLLWQEQKSDSTGHLRMQGEILLPVEVEERGTLRGILEVIGHTGVIWADTVTVAVVGHDTTPPRIRSVRVAIDGERLTVFISDRFFDEMGTVVRMVARIVRLPDSTEVAAVPLQSEGSRFVGVWVLPADLREATLGVAIEATDDAGNTGVSGIIQQVTLREQQPVSGPSVTRIGKGQIGNGIAFSPDGTLLAVAGSVGIWLYDADALAEVGLLQGHTGGGASSVAFSPDGTMIASGGWDTTVRLWDVARHKQVAVWEGHRNSVSSVAFSPDGGLLASGSQDNTVRLWDVTQQQEVAVLPWQLSIGTSVAFSPDGELLALGAYRAVLLWDVTQRQEVAILRVQSGFIASVAFSSDGRLLASSGDVVRLWDVTQRNIVGVLQAGMGSWADFSPDGTLLVSGSWDGLVQVWDVLQQKRVGVLTGHTSVVWGAVFSPDGTRLASASLDGTVRLWDVTQRTAIATLRGYTGGVYAMAFSPDSGILTMANSDNTIRLWDVPRQQEVAVLKGNVVWPSAFGPDGTLLASASGNVIHLWDVPRQQEVGVLRGHTGGVSIVAFSPDGNTLASGGGDSDPAVRVWDVAQRTAIATLRGYTGGVSTLAFSPDGQTLASASASGIIRLWDMVQQREVAVLRGHTGWVYGIAFRPDGKMIASAGGDSTVRLWDGMSYQEIAVLQRYTSVVTAVTFSPDGATLAWGSGDGTVHLWDVMSRQEIAILRGYTTIGSLVFSPDGRTLASRNYDSTVLLWEVIPTAVEPSSAGVLPSALPQRTALLPAYPNPGNPGVWLPYELAKDAEVMIRIYNVVGQVVRTLEVGRRAAGRYLSRGSAAFWDGRTVGGKDVASGVYYYTLYAGSVVTTRKLVVVR